MATIISREGTPLDINPPDPHLETKITEAELEEFHRQHDENIGKTFLKMMTALGYDVDLEKAVEVSKDEKGSTKICDEYHQLVVTKRKDDITANLERILRGL